jgi:hypothetical protein
VDRSENEWWARFALPTLRDRLRRSAPRNDEDEANARIPAAWFARVLHHLWPHNSEGAGNAGAMIAPAALRAGKKARKQVTTGTPKHPAFPARWFSAYGALSRGAGLAPVASRGVSGPLGPTSPTRKA